MVNNSININKAKGFSSRLEPLNIRKNTLI